MAVQLASVTDIIVYVVVAVGFTSSTKGFVGTGMELEPLPSSPTKVKGAVPVNVSVSCEDSPTQMAGLPVTATTPVGNGFTVTVTAAVLVHAFASEPVTV